VSIAALYVAAHIVKDIKIKDFAAAALAALALELANLVVPWLLHLMAPAFHVLPADVIRFLVFALLFWGVGSLVPGFKVSGPAAAVVGALVLILLWAGLHWLMLYLPHFRLPVG
jgi:putative membrane protein